MKLVQLVLRKKSKPIDEVNAVRVLPEMSNWSFMKAFFAPYKKKLFLFDVVVFCLPVDTLTTNSDTSKLVLAILVNWHLSIGIFTRISSYQHWNACENASVQWGVKNSPYTQRNRYLNHAKLNHIWIVKTFCFVSFEVLPRSVFHLILLLRFIFCVWCWAIDWQRLIR